LKLLAVKTEFVRQTVLMFIGISLFNFLNFLYNLFMVRYLSPIDYGHLNSLLAFFMVISVPANTVQTAITRFVSPLYAQGEYGHIKGLLRHFLIVISIVAFIFFVLISMASPLISSFLQIPSNIVVILLGISLLFAMVNPVPLGGLQGLQRFGSFALNLIINGGLNLALGIAFIFWGLRVLGAVSAIAIAYFITFILSLFMLACYLPKTRPSAHQGEDVLGDSRSPFSGTYYYFFSVGITLLCFMILTNIDLLLIKHYFSPIEAGYYSIAQLVGKIILYLPYPIVMVMFPKLVSSENDQRGTPLILTQSLLISLFLCGGAVLFSFFFPSLLLRILSGKIYFECIPLMRFFSVNMTFFALNLILLYYHLSTQKRGFLYPLLFLTLVQVVLIVLFHNSVIQILITVGVIAFCLLGVNFFLAYLPHRKVMIE
jgi:O-antigen/teichoic acid export membrane protein